MWKASKLVFYFTAENRVDFRELVKDLVQKFKTRIELRQIGARHEARIVKGMGICGREICCVNLLNNLDRVSVKDGERTEHVFESGENFRSLWKAYVLSGF
jgi:cell fate regulator YaaT (PSP1 superfamily)